MTTVHDAAAAITSYFDSSISTMKLQKLTFFAQGWSIGLTNEPMFDTTFEAWRNGPVTYDLYSHHRSQYFVGSWSLGDAGRLTEPHQIVLDAVLKNYGGLSGLQLSELTHAPGTPWSLARTRAGVSEGESSQEAIRDDDMKTYFRDLLQVARGRH